MLYLTCGLVHVSRSSITKLGFAPVVPLYLEDRHRCEEVDA